MRKKNYQFIIAFLLISNVGFAQWGGSTTVDGDAYRNGKVTIGGTWGPGKFNVGVTDQNDGIWLAGNSSKSISLMVNMTPGAWNPLAQHGDNLLMWKAANIDQAEAGGLVIGPWSNSEAGMRITSTGNVGIGTANPGTFKLAVNGKIGARQIHVTLQNPFPDYVFDSKYKLRSLYNLENYINQNKHLPGIPSAAEVEKNGGIDLGQMNTKLLEKVEELTLYIIEINKKVEKLEKENKSLKGK